MKQKWFEIKDLPNFTDYSRALVFTTFGQTNQVAEDYFTNVISNINSDDKEEMDKILTYEESFSIVEALTKKKIFKKTNRVCYYITDEILMSIIESLNSRLISNILNKLVNDGVLDSAYDTDANDFIFWVKENNEKDKPETD